MGKTVKVMKTKVIIEMPYATDFLLLDALQTAMRKYWKDSLFMLSRGYTYEVPYYRERIDAIADMYLQAKNQI